MTVGSMGLDGTGMFTSMNGLVFVGMNVGKYAIPWIRSMNSGW